MYHRPDGYWKQLGQDIIGEALGDQFGISVSLSSDGKTLAVGANTNDNENGEDSGHVRVFGLDDNGSSWKQIGQDIDGEAAFDYSGYSVSLSADGNIVAIGADWNDGNGEDSGHVRVYQMDVSSSAWTQLGQNVEGEAAGDDSGISVSLSSDGNGKIGPLELVGMMTMVIAQSGANLVKILREKRHMTMIIQVFLYLFPPMAGQLLLERLGMMEMGRMQDM